MRKTIALLMSCTIVLALVLTGCGAGDKKAEPSGSAAASASPSAGGEKVKVRLAYWNKEENVKTLLDLIKEKLPNVDLEYQFIDATQYDTIIKTQLAAGEGPDIIGGLIDETTVKLGYFEDLTPRFGGKYYDSGTSYVTFDGKLYGLPQASWFNGVFYNIDLFKQYGLQVPKTLDEYFEVAQKLKDNGVKPQAIGLKNANVAMQSFIALALNDYIGTPEGKNFDDAFRTGEETMKEALLPALNTWTEYLKRGIFTKDMLGLEEEQAIDEFTSGKAAMFQSGPWYMETFKQKNPDMNIGMFPNPGTKGGPGWMVGGPGVAFGINANSPAKEAAFEVLELLSTPEGQQAYWSDNKGGSSYLKGVVFEMPPEYNDAQEAFKAGNVYFPPNGWGTLRNPIIDELGKLIQAVVGDQATPEQALEAVDKKAASLRSK
ncbi:MULTISPECIES: ABC transporter substrate-binding protein [Cohnella]|uniref:Carbohydrate ABC transporter substrate-binding protein (CUT1 family) n=1 Tax=Cohnella phaseoli TaxID=456490 RepID=A0A3D9I405_9BACL|nr:sugar ABC transporter substrate-binding protein [Cohnella phaseoli]RED56498.1 carbohydrate ABC transporter substrate-binding protein (CUT1 family) [Cohnella phaseoli]